MENDRNVAAPAAAQNRQTGRQALRPPPDGRQKPTGRPFSLIAAAVLFFCLCVLSVLPVSAADTTAPAAPAAPAGRFSAAAPAAVPVSAPASAVPAAETTADASAEDVGEWLARLRDTLPEGADDPGFSDTDEVVRTLGVRRLLEIALQGFSASFPTVLARLCVFCGAALLGGMARMLSSSLGRASLAASTDAVCAAAVALCVWQTLFGVIASAAADLRDLRTFCGGMWGVFAALLSLGGNTGAAAAQSASVGLWLTVCEEVAAAVLLPLCFACLGCSLLGALTGGTAAEGIAGTLRRICLSLLGVLALIFSASVAFQTAVASAADSAALRGARYAVGQMIPAVGSSISGALSTLAASLSLLRGAVGGAAVVCLLSLALPPLIELLLTSLALSAAGGLASLFGFPGGKKLFDGCKGVCDMLLAALGLSVASALVLAAVFVRTNAAVA